VICWELVRSQRKIFFGLSFVRKSCGTNWDSYYGTIDALRPLFKSEDFSKTVSGFYLNHINESVRISYFVSEESKQMGHQTRRTRGGKKQKRR
jgi:hypothetical protein